MRRPRFQRTVQNPLGMPGAAVLAATIAVAVLANGAICTAVHAQQRDPVDQRRRDARRVLSAGPAVRCSIHRGNRHDACKGD